MPVVEYAELPTALTEPLVAPAAPAFKCVQPNGQQAVCVHDGLMREIEWHSVLDRANADRATSAFLSVGAGAAARSQPASRSSRLEDQQSQLLRQAFRINTSRADK